MSLFLRWLFETRLRSLKADAFSSMVNISRMWVTWFLDFSAFPLIHLLHQITGYFAACLKSPLAPITPSLQWECWWRHHSGLWTLLSYSRPGVLACGDFTPNVGVKPRRRGKIYSLNPDSWPLTPTSASKSRMKERELVFYPKPQIDISASHQWLRWLFVVFPDGKPGACDILRYFWKYD